MRFKGYFLLILVVGFFLRVLNLGSESLWNDEGASVRIAKLPLVQILNENKSDANPPLYYIILHLWMKVFGDSEFSVRFPSVLFGVLAIFFLYKFSKIAFGEKVALFSVLLLSISPFHIFYSQEARMYELLALMNIVSFYFFVKTLTSRSFANFLALTLSNLALIYTHSYGFFVLLVQFVFTVLFQRAMLKKFLVSTFAVMFFYLPRLLILFQQAGLLVSGEFWLPVPNFLTLVWTFIQFAGGTYPVPKDEAGRVVLKNFIVEYFAPLALLCLFAFLFFVSAKNFKNFNSDKKLNFVLLVLWLFVPILVPFVLSQFLTPFFFARYIIGSSVAVFVIASLGLESLNEKRIKFLLTLAIVLSLLGDFMICLKVNKEQWREAVRFVEGSFQKEDILIFNADFVMGNVFDYYSRRSDMTKVCFPENGAKVDEGNISQLREVIRGRKRVWFISSHSTDPKGLIKDVLCDSLNLVSAKKFLGIEVYLFEK